MPRRPAARRRPGRRGDEPRPPGPSAVAAGRRPRLRARGPLIGLALVALGALLVVGLWPTPARRAARAEAAARAGDWAAALRHWRALNESGRGDARSYLGEARAALALGRAAEAERALARATGADPADPEPRLLRLEILRLEGRTAEAQAEGWAAFDAVPPDARPEVLRALTLALLAEPPEDLARATLDRWGASDPADLDARVARIALDQRLAAGPHAGDAGRRTPAAELEAILARDPGHVAAREALVVTLADAGRLDGAGPWLGGWPADARDARYWRLLGRWQLDARDQPEAAAGSLTRALADQPHDWKARALLARALRALGRPDDARAQAEAVARLRERLDPARLGPRLDADLAHPDDPRAAADLAGLCASVGLDRLADAWRRVSSQPRASKFPDPPT